MDIDTRLDKLERSLDEVRDDLRTLRQLKPLNDPGAVLNKIRRITEGVVFRLCKRHDISWGSAEASLGRMAGPLRAAGVLPRTIKAHVDTIISYTNVGSHHQEVRPDDSHVQIAQMAMLPVLEWYFEHYAGGATERQHDDFLDDNDDDLDDFLDDGPSPEERYEQAAREELLGAGLTRVGKARLSRLRKELGLDMEVAKGIYLSVRGELGEGNLERNSSENGSTLSPSSIAQPHRPGQDSEGIDAVVGFVDTEGDRIEFRLIDGRLHEFVNGEHELFLEELYFHPLTWRFHDEEGHMTPVREAQTPALLDSLERMAQKAGVAFVYTLEFTDTDGDEIEFWLVGDQLQEFVNGDFDLRVTWLEIDRRIFRIADENGTMRPKKKYRTQEFLAVLQDLANRAGFSLSFVN